MFQKAKFFACVVATFVLAHGAGAQTIDVQFQSNKTEYICGEPVLLKTTVSNPSTEEFKGTSPGYGWAKDVGFTMYIARGDEDLANILAIETIRRLRVSTPPLQYTLFSDRHWLPQNLSPGQRAQRLDMLIVPKPGDYTFKAVLQERDGKTYSSKPISFRVMPIEEMKDSISHLGEQDFVINLGYSIHKAHYVEEFWGPFSPEEFEELAPVIIEKHKDSVFREYAMYADILTHGRPERSTHELIKGRKELAQRFVREYPDSWLLPEIYRKLFWTYVAEKNREKAEQMRARALEIAPHASVLRYVRAYDTNTLRGEADRGDQGFGQLTFRIAPDKQAVLPLEPVTQRIAKGSWEEWGKVVNENVNTTNAMVRGLQVVAQDDRRDGEERIYAIILMGKTRSDEAIGFLFENISLWITKRDFFSDDDELKQQPCFYTLRTMGWQVVPHALEFVRQKRTPQELELVARVLKRICGARMARAILETKLQQMAYDRVDDLGQKNIQALLEYLSAAEARKSEH